MARVFGITTFGQLRDEALRYSEQYGYPVSTDAVTGNLNRRGQRDVRDAFRHIYLKWRHR